MAILSVLVHPNPILRKISDPVTQIDETILKLLDDMVDTMNHARGIGLAAPQVGINKRVLVIDVGDRPYPAQNIGLLKIINPKIISFSEEKTELEEGCLSLPEMDCLIFRPEQIVVEYTDENNKMQNLTANGILAKCFQHEIDHLDGKLIFDYLSPLKRSIVLRRYNKMMRMEQ
jgi:peptide deformylase